MKVEEKGVDNNEHVFDVTMDFGEIESFTLAIMKKYKLKRSYVDRNFNKLFNKFAIFVLSQDTKNDKETKKKKKD